MMELADLRVFLRIAELKSISATARSLEQPKSSISRALARLEGEVGALLIDRGMRYIRLTDAGTTLYPHAKLLLASAEEAQAAVDGFGEVPRGKLKVNAPYTFAVGLLAPMLAAFTRRYPEVQLVLDIDNKVIDVAAEEVDVAIRIGALPDSDLVAQRLTTIALWTCASPAYLEKHGVPRLVKDLAGHTLLSRENRISRWRYRTESGEEQDLEVLPGTVIPEPTVLQSVVIDGGGVGRLPDFLAAPAVARGELVRLLPRLVSDAVDVHVVYTSRRSLSAKSRVFIESLREHLSQRPASGS